MVGGFNKKEGVLTTFDIIMKQNCVTMLYYIVPGAASHSKTKIKSS